MPESKRVVDLRGFNVAADTAVGQFMAVDPNLHWAEFTIATDVTAFVVVIEDATTTMNLLSGSAGPQALAAGAPDSGSFPVRQNSTYAFEFSEAQGVGAADTYLDVVLVERRS